MSSEYGEMHKMKKGSKMSRMMMKAIKPLETSPVDPPSNDQQKPSLPYSNSPHSGETQTMYLDLFSGIVGSAVYTPGTIYYQAAEWIINLDEQTLDINDPTLSQRYLLALFYYTTTQNGQPKWRSCNPVGNNEAEFSNQDCIYDKFISRAVNDTFEFQGFPAKRWLSSSPECEWAGVTCNEFNFVTKLELFGQNIAGTLPTEIAVLPYLQSIALIYNNFTGTIPSEYGTIKNLNNLELHINLLTGTIPDELWNAVEMIRFNVNENMLTGTVSTKIGRLSKLLGFFISDNMYTGTLPTEIGNAGLLTYMRFDSNSLSGNLPTWLGQCTQLKELWAQNNDWTGTIPSELGLLQELVNFRVNSAQISGTIPDSLYNLGKLSRLDMSDLTLTGTLSTYIGNLVSLVDLRIQGNKLSGTIPSEIANLYSLKRAWLHLNLFEGSVPVEICVNRQYELEFLQADCDPLDAPANACECCTACCDRDTEICTIK